MKHGFDGVSVYPEERRAYPQRTVAASLLGYAGVDNEGLAGLEYGFDKLLKGRPGVQTIVKDPFGRAIDTISSTPEHEGSDLFLTIDHTIQAEAESVLRKTVHEWGAKSGVAVVLDPRNGEVLAMAEAPTYDANAFPKVNPAFRKVRAVTDLYEPGSTFKLVTVSAALSEKLVTPQTKFTLPYSIRVADRTVHDAERRGTETMSVAQDPDPLVERRRGHPGGEAGQEPARRVDRPLRLRQGDRDRLPRREPRHRPAAWTSGTARRSATSRSDRGSR